MLFDCAFLVLSQALKRINYIAKIRSDYPEVFLKKVFGKYAAILQENTHAEVQFQ